MCLYLDFFLVWGLSSEILVGSTSRFDCVGQYGSFAVYVYFCPISFQLISHCSSCMGVVGFLANRFCVSNHVLGYLRAQSCSLS